MVVKLYKTTALPHGMVSRLVSKKTNYFFVFSLVIPTNLSLYIESGAAFMVFVRFLFSSYVLQSAYSITCVCVCVY